MMPQACFTIIHAYGIALQSAKYIGRNGFDDGMQRL